MPERDQIIRDTFARVLGLVDEAYKSMNSDDKTSFHLLLWRSAAEAEYLAFQVSMVHGLSDLVPNVHSSYADSGKAVGSLGSAPSLPVSKGCCDHSQEDLREQ
jgi:hypothetical protein